MTTGDRPDEILCDKCGKPVRVKPSGRIPKRHTNGCPTDSVVEARVVDEPDVEPDVEPVDEPVDEPETAPATPTAPTAPSAPSAPAGRLRQISPYVWVDDAGRRFDGEGRQL